MGVGGCDTFAVTPGTAALQAQATAGAVAARAQAAMAPSAPPAEPPPATPPPFAIRDGRRVRVREGRRTWTVVEEDSPRTLRVAFLGNSLTFFNDLPHLLQHILATTTTAIDDVKVGCCLRGGQSLPSLLTKGADMGRAKLQIGGRDMYATVEELLTAPGGWDYVVVNDHSQAPARDDAQPALVDSAPQPPTGTVPATHTHSLSRPVWRQTASRARSRAAALSPRSATATRRCSSGAAPPSCSSRAGATARTPSAASSSAISRP